MLQKFKSLKIRDKIILIGGIIFLVVSGAFSAVAAYKNANLPICDGTTTTSNCQDEAGIKYSKYIYHEAVKEVTKVVNHPAKPAKTHTVHHDAVYGTRQVKDCVRTNISYKNGTCALSLCRDGLYSGSTGRGTCSYHGGVYARGPWYTYRTEQYIVTPAWDEVIEDEPAKEAWSETVVVTPARDAYIEKVEVK